MQSPPNDAEGWREEPQILESDDDRRWKQAQREIEQLDRLMGRRMRFGVWWRTRVVMKRRKIAEKLLGYCILALLFYIAMIFLAVLMDLPGPPSPFR